MGELTLPRQYSGNAVTPHTLHCCQDSRLVIDQHIMVSRIASLNIVEFVLFVDVYQNTTVNCFEDTGSLYFARLKDNIAVGQYGGLSPGAQVLQHIQCSRIKAIREWVVH